MTAMPKTNWSGDKDGGLGFCPAAISKADFAGLGLCCWFDDCGAPNYPTREGWDPMARLMIALGVTLIFTPAPEAAAQDPVAALRPVRTIKIGGEGGWDSLEVDAANRRLYVSRGTRVLVIDLDTEKVVGEIPDTPGVHGIAFVPDLNRGFTSNGGDSTVTAFDLKTLKTLGKVKANGRPDIISFEPVSRRVLTFNHGTNDITAIDPVEC